MITTVCATRTAATSGRQEADREQQAADELDQCRHRAEQPGRPEAHVRHRAFPAGQAGTAPPAEDLLGAVRGERQPDRELEDERERSFAPMSVRSCLDMCCW